MGNRYELTPRQREIVAFLREFTQGHGRPPTRQELCAAFGFRSPNAAQSHLQTLEERGVIAIDRGRARGIRLLACPDEALDTVHYGTGLPIVGRVAAGRPILAQEAIEGFWPVPGHAFRPQADYLLRVQGDSMTGAGILSHDLVAVHRTPHAEAGQIVVARLEDEVTVKIWRPNANGKSAVLLPANPRYLPITVGPETRGFAIEGVVVGVIRALTHSAL